MGEQYQEPTPRQVAEIHESLVSDSRYYDEQLGRLEGDKALFESDLYQLREDAALQDVLLSMQSPNEMKNFIDTQLESNPSELLKECKNAFDEGGFDLLQDLLTRNIDAYRADIAADELTIPAMQEGQDDAQQTATEAVKDVQDFTKSKRDKLLTAAYAEAALDGKQINHPDALNITDLTNEMTPKEVAETHAALVKEQQDEAEDASEATGRLEQDKLFSENELKEAKEELALHEQFLAFENDETATNFIDAQLKSNPSRVIERYKEILKASGFRLLHEEAYSRTEKQKSTIQSLEDKVESINKNIKQKQAPLESARENLHNFTERFSDMLVTAALGEAALDGVQINHPDAIKIQK